MTQPLSAKGVAVAFVLAVVVAVAAAAGPLEAQTLSLHSKAAILIDAQSGRILYEQNAAEALPPASVTKVMTLILAMEAVQSGRASLDDPVVTSAYAASMGGTQIWLEPGEEMPLGELIQAVAIGSANDAAVAIAEHLGGSEPGFVDMMNARARELGAESTQFQNPSGLPPTSVGKSGSHVTSASDLALMSRHAVSLPGFLELTSTWGPVVMRPTGSQKPVLWSYHNMLKTYPGMDGIKTGMTSEAGFCLSATAVRNGLRLIAVTLGAPTRPQRDEDIGQLLDYGFSRLKAVQVAAEGMTVTDMDVLKGERPHLALTARTDLYVSLDKTSDEQPTTIVEYVRDSAAPFDEGEVVAELVARLGSTEVGRVELIASTSVRRATIMQLIGTYFKQMLTGEESRRGA